MAGPGSRLTRFPLSAVIDLHEIHLARQSSLQVPVGHIPVPGGIKLCSPGTFLVANYLIINNGSFQVNFTKSKRATIRYTNSQWLSEDPTEASVGKVAVKNPVVNPTLIPSTVPISFPSARDPAPELLVGRVVVPKKGQKPLSPRREATGVLVGRAAVPKTGQKNSLPRRDGSGVLVGRVAVPSRL